MQVVAIAGFKAGYCSGPSLDIVSAKAASATQLCFDNTRMSLHSAKQYDIDCRQGLKGLKPAFCADVLLQI